MYTLRVQGSKKEIFGFKQRFGAGFGGVTGWIGNLRQTVRAEVFGRGIDIEKKFDSSRRIPDY